MIPALAVSIIEMDTVRELFHVHGITDWEKTCLIKDGRTSLVHDHDVYGRCDGKRCHYEFTQTVINTTLYKMLNATD